MADCRNNPCSCLCQYIPPATPCSSKTGCLRLGYIIVKPENSVGPCGQQGSVSFSCFDFSGCCTKDVKIVVQSNSAPDKITINSITKEKLVFTTTEAAEPGDKIKILIKATCCDLGDYGEITIFIKDDCACENCEAGYTCDKCTATCIPIPPGNIIFDGATSKSFTENEINFPE